jgi:hypothetical protein
MSDLWFSGSAAMIEIGPVVDDAVALAHSWNRRVIDDAMEGVVRESKYSIDLDEEAGEEWCRF